MEHGADSVATVKQPTDRGFNIATPHPANPIMSQRARREMGWLPPSTDGIAMCQVGGVETY